jgi:hypothetical protein
MPGLGKAYAEALARKDFGTLASLMQPVIDFRGMTPRKSWEAGTPEELVQDVLRQWFEDSDEIEELVSLEADSFADCERVGYRFSVTNPDGRFLVEQQAYLREEEGRIAWIRVMCSGFRPIG